MTRAGLIHRSATGVYSMLPAATRVLSKVERIIDKHLSVIGCNKLSMPLLLPSDLWKETGRWDSVGPELFRVNDRHDVEYCLAPTHEEAITSIVSDFAPSKKTLPLRLYQTGKKYRDEARPRYGIMRAREFIMKDLYTFDETKELALKTYDAVRSAYHKIFNEIGLDVVVAAADSGNIGGQLSHEFHVLSDVGEDDLLSCSRCEYTANVEWVASDHLDNITSNPSSCLNPPSPCDKELLVQRKGIEVGHLFYLGSKYSQVLGAVVRGMGSESHPMEMGCYGLGVSRIVATVVEQYADEKGMRWPKSIAPFQGVIVPLLDSVEFTELANSLYDELIHRIPALNDDLVLDDRDRKQMSLGAKLTEVLCVCVCVCVSVRFYVFVCVDMYCVCVCVSIRIWTHIPLYVYIPCLAVRVVRFFSLHLLLNYRRTFLAIRSR